MNAPESTEKPAPDPTRRRALGKGLESLLPRGPAPRISEADPAPPPDRQGGSAREITLTDIDRSPYQTRQHHDDQQLIELAASITMTGVVQPILVRPLANGRYQLIAGERRWLASRLAKKETIPAIVRQASDAQAMEMTIVENLQRADLNPMEQARAFDRLGREFHLTQEQIAARTGKDRASVTNFLRLLRLPESVQQYVETGELSFGHARALLMLPSLDQMARAGQRIVALSMSVRQAEGYIQGLLNPDRKQQMAKAKQAALDPNVREAQESLQRVLGLKVQIEDKRGRGRLIVEYGNLDDFEALVDLLSRPL